MSQRLDAAYDACRGARATRAEQPPDLFSQPQSWEQPASASPEWKDAVLDIIRRTAERQPTLTVEDLGPLPWTYDQRAVGAVLLAAARRGWIEAEGWARGGPERHGRPVRLWRSRICVQVGP